MAFCGVRLDPRPLPSEEENETTIGAATRSVEKWTVIGVIGVDTGTIAIGDPGYLRDVPDHPLRDWDRCCDLLEEAGNPAVALLGGSPRNRSSVRSYDPERPTGTDAGLGLIISTGADGGYPVEAHLVDGRVAELRIRFFTP